MDVKILSIFEHVYIITGWWLMDFIEMNDNEILLLSKHFYIPLCCRSYNCKAKGDLASPNILHEKYFMKFDISTEVHSLLGSLLLDFRVVAVNPI